MEGNIEAVPHIEHLREIQPLVLDGLNYSKVFAPPSCAFHCLFLTPPSAGPSHAAHRFCR